MLCSNCSHKVLPIVGIDIDGTLGEFHGHFWDFARGYLGVPYPDRTDTYLGAGSFKEWFMANYAVDEATWYDIKLAYRQGGMKRTMPIRGGAANLVRRVKAAGAEVWLCTVRPYNRLDNIDPDTQEWLGRNDVPFDHLLYDDDKYGILSERVDPSRVVAVLDDLPEMCLAADRAFGPDVPILMRTAYNLAVLMDIPFVASSFTEAEAMIKKRIQLWNHKHQQKGRAA